MEKKNFNLLISIMIFLLGGFFVLSDDASITANAIGSSGTNYATSSIVGIVMIIASAAFFILSINHGDLALERLVHENEKNHTNIGTIKSEIENQDLKKRYEHEGHDYNK